MTYTIKLRRGTASDWTAVNPILAEGEAGVELDTLYVKIGDGVTAWNGLEYVVGPGTGLPEASGLPDGQMMITQSGAWVVSDAPEEEVGSATITTEHVATAGQVNFALPSAPVPGTVRVYRNGVRQASTHWSVVDLTVTLVDACSAGELIQLVQDGPVGVIMDQGPAGPEGPEGPEGPMGPPGVNGLDASRGPIAINPQTGTAYTLVLEDATKMVTMDNAAASTLTVPPESAVAFPIGTQIEGVQLGAGQVTIVAGSGVTINADPGLKVAAQHAIFGLTKIDNDVWVAYGRLSA